MSEPRRLGELLFEYGPWITPERVAELFARWAADDAAGVPSPPLCRRCGQLLRFTDRPSQQLHVWCEPASASRRDVLTRANGNGSAA